MRFLCRGTGRGGEHERRKVMADVRKLATEIAAMVETKQAAYGDAHGRAGDVLRVLYPEGIPVSAYTDALTVVRVVDKLFRIATDRDALGEDPWRDIAGYALLGAAARAGDGSGSGIPQGSPVTALAALQWIAGGVGTTVAKHEHADPNTGHVAVSLVGAARSYSLTDARPDALGHGLDHETAARDLLRSFRRYGFTMHPGTPGERKHSPVWVRRQLRYVGYEAGAE